MIENVTKEGIEVRIGQVWRDLDKRMNNRHCIVEDVNEGKALMSRCRPDGSWRSSNHTKVSVSRMHKSSTGWALVQESGAGND